MGTILNTGKAFNNAAAVLSSVLCFLDSCFRRNDTVGALVIDTPPHPSLSIVNYPLSTDIPIFPAQNADPMSEKTERLPSPKIILTDEQRNVVEAFEQFLTGDNKVFILLGAAGTGKTTLLSDLIRVA